MPSGNPALPRGRVIFSADATASREHAWHIARDLQAKMFIQARSVGAAYGLDRFLFLGKNHK